MEDFSDYSDLNHVRPVKKIALAFICQRGELEIQALLLAASIRKFVSFNCELIAVVPTPESIMGKPRDQTLAMLERLGVRIERVENKIISSLESHEVVHFFTNKHFTLSVETDADKFIFLDSDIIFRSGFGDMDRFKVPLNLIPVGLEGAKDYCGHYNRIFRDMGVEIPHFLMRKQNPHPFYFPPSFNTHFISVDSDLKLELMDAWNQMYYQLLDHDSFSISSHVEQIAFTLAVHKLKLPFELIYPQNHLSERPYRHYFSASKLRSFYEDAAVARRLIMSNTELLDLIKTNETDPSWRFLLKTDLSGFIKSKLRRRKL